MQKRRIPIPLAAGMDTRTERTKVPAGKLLALKNGWQKKNGGIRKRNGYEKLTKKSDDGDNWASSFELQSVNSLHALDEQLLAMAVDGDASNDPDTGPGVFSWWPTGAWRRVNGSKAARVSSAGVLARDEDDDVKTFDPTVCVGDRHVMVVSSEATGGSGTGFVAFHDKDTGAQVALYDDAVQGNASCVFFPSAGKFMVLYYKTGGNDLFGRIFDEATLDVSLPSEIHVLNNLMHTDGLFDVCMVDDATAIVAHEHTSGGLYIHEVDSSGTLGASAWNGESMATGPICVRALTNSFTGTTRVHVLYMYGASANEVRCTHWTTSLGSQQSPWTIDTVTAGGTLKQITMARDTKTRGGTGSADYFSIFLMSEHGSNAHFDYVWTTYIPINDTSSTTAPGGGFRLRRCGLKTHAFEYDGRAYVGLSFNATGQETDYFWTPSVSTSIAAEAHSTVMAPLHPRNCSGRRQHDANLCQVADMGNGVFKLAHRRKVSLDEDASVFYSVDLVDLDLNPDPIRSELFHGSLVLGGCDPRVYTGSIEPGGATRGFDTFPEITNTGDAGSGGSMSDGTYSIKVIYEYTDPQGRRHRSAPSTLESHTLSHGGSSQQITVTVGYPSLHYPQFTISVYRTEDGGSLYYLAATKAVDYSSAYSADTTTVDLTIDDATLIANGPLYTDSGELESRSMPPGGIMAAAGDHLLVVPDYDRDSVWVSKPARENVGLEFSGLLRVHIREGGDITALAVLDGRVIAFKEKSIHAFTLQPTSVFGPVRSSAPRRLPTDTGCTDPNSLLVTAQGIYFKGHKGIYLLTRSLTVEPIGLPADDYSQYTVLAATLMEDKRLCVFDLSGAGESLIYDYEHGAWGTWEYDAGNAEARDSVVWDGKHVWVDGSAQVWSETDGTYLDGTTAIDMLADLPWVHIGRLTGFQRLWWIYILGEYISAHDLKISIWYDGQDSGAAAEVFTYSPTSDPGEYLARAKPAQQKCRSFRLRIEDDNQQSDYESLRLTELEVEVGVKRGGHKVPSARTL